MTPSRSFFVVVYLFVILCNLLNADDIMSNENVTLSAENDQMTDKESTEMAVKLVIVEKAKEKLEKEKNVRSENGGANLISTTIATENVITTLAVEKVIITNSMAKTVDETMLMAENGTKVQTNCDAITNCLTNLFNSISSSDSISNEEGIDAVDSLIRQFRIDRIVRFLKEKITIECNSETIGGNADFIRQLDVCADALQLAFHVIDKGAMRKGTNASAINYEALHQFNLVKIESLPIEQRTRLSTALRTIIYQLAPNQLWCNGAHSGLTENAFRYLKSLKRFIYDVDDALNIA